MTQSNPLVGKKDTISQQYKIKHLKSTHYKNKKQGKLMKSIVKGQKYVIPEILRLLKNITFI
ncbi:hypothetical protein XM47_16465 [Catenovulum maritimum]|uniref:Uncharacterized protein n=1 Tax=Catenovulum maritimum TaxID=1513271 RepID=A0A0J8GMN6_9ALTE|nr:hypothetical protein XM47_16465 [Catenovulum maritimum]